MFLFTCDTIHTTAVLCPVKLVMLSVLTKQSPRGDCFITTDFLYIFISLHLHLHRIVISHDWSVMFTGTTARTDDTDPTSTDHSLTGLGVNETRRELWDSGKGVDSWLLLLSETVSFPNCCFSTVTCSRC